MWNGIIQLLKRIICHCHGLNLFKNTLQGNFTEVYTDNQNCVTTRPSTSKRMKRWQLLIQDFNIVIKKIEGKKNNIADYLSRMMSLQIVKKEKKERFKEKIQKFITQEVDQLGRFIVREDVQTDFIKFIHKYSGHPGMSKTYQNIRQYYYIKNIKATVENVVKNCRKCNYYKVKIENKKPTVRIRACAMFDKISTDTYGPFSLESILHEGEGQKGYFVTITDIYSRISEVYFAYQVTGETVIKALKKWTRKYGKPKTMISDNGTEYKNQTVEKWTNQETINHIFIPPYAPYANGISEVINKIITEIIKMNYKRSIGRIKKKIRFRLNENVHRALGQSPNSLLRGYSFYDLNEQPIKPTPEIIQEKTKAKGIYKIADEVYVRNMNKNLDTREYIGSYRIVEIGDKQRWVKVEALKDWIHVRSIKP